MDRLKQNAFWVATAGLFIASLFIYIVLVKIKSSELKSVHEDIANYRLPAYPLYYCYQHSDSLFGDPEGICAVCNGKLEKEVKLPSRGALNVYKNHLSDKMNSRLAMLSFYDNIDAGFERWFPELQTKNNEKPNVGEFISYYPGKFNALVDKIKLERIMYNFEEDVFSSRPQKRDGGFDMPSPKQDASFEELKSAQKKYWIQAKVADAAIENRILRLEAVYFELVNIYRTQQKDSKYNDLITKEPRLQPSVFGENLKGTNFEAAVSNIRFTVIVQIPYKKTAEFIASVLAYDENNSMLITLNMMKVVKIAEAPDEVSEDKLAAPPIQLYAVFDVIDFDMSKVRNGLEQTSSN